ncbi:MAG: PSD1 and planctomycete cytochrome C domain-containing protein [Pirellulaceae bacterium]
MFRGRATLVTLRRRIRRGAFCFSWALLLALLSANVLLGEATAAERDDAKAAFFEAKIRPVLVQHCYKCHSASAGKSEGSLTLDTRSGIRAGGDRGAAVVPGKPKQSILLEAVAHTNDDLQMPPKKERLPESVIADFERWIREGAFDPRDEASAARPPVDVEAGRRFWAYQPPRRQAPPDVENDAWPKRDLDRYVLAKLESAGLRPSADAPHAALLRRLFFDLVGLPPSPAELVRFQRAVKSDGIDAALEAEVDALLASPQFGERWGRHWLDVARFAESSGKEANISFPYAWRYRDYVIDCFNDDVPFDRFLTEQIAGDLLPHENDDQRARLLIATGFLALGPKNLDEASALQFAADVIDEQIDAVSRAVLANSIACARCHDHKFDPYTMEDYYALAGVFASTKTYFGTAVSPANRMAGDPLVLPEVEGQQVLHAGIPAKRVEELKTQLAALKQEEEEGRAAVMKAIAAGEDPGDVFTLTDALRIFWQSGGIEGQLEKVDESGKALPLAMGVLDAERILDVPLLQRGDIHRAGEPVPRGFPEILAIDGLEPSKQQSGRLQLARWLTHQDNPLTARVMANRVWHYVFGAGIVRTVDNFGMTGEPPSHAELLDHLTLEFVQGGWSVKQLVRELVLSRTYRQASTFDEQAFRADPDNRLLWRMPKRRLDAEAIRDAMLAVAGELDADRPTGSLVARTIGDKPISLIGLDKRIPADLDDSLHRSVYLPVLRDRLPDVLDLFDFAEPSLVTGARETTNVPVQALYLMNSPFVQARAKALAARIMQESDSDDARIRRAFELCFSRLPDAMEFELARQFITEGRRPIQEKQEKSDESEQQLLTNYCQALLCTAEFRNLD